MSDITIFDAIVVGTGLAGLVVTLEVLDRGGTVALIEKEPKMGGNSIKASSGINACVPSQLRLPPLSDIVGDDEIKSFVDDTLKSAGDRANPGLVQILVEQSTDRLRWLQQRVDVDLFHSRARLGGHSRERTHRPTKGTIGFTLISAMKTEVEKYQSTGRLRVMLSTKVINLLRGNPDGDDDDSKTCRVSGVKVSTQIDGGEGDDENTTNEQENIESSIFGRNVVLATGGFAADRSPTSILAKNAPADYFMRLPATFGSFSTGDGIQLATQLGASTVDLDMIQIHPTGFVDQNDPANPSKILCAELMRGTGGILLDKDGKRFCNELGTRDYVVGEMLKMCQKTAESLDGNFESVFPQFYILLSQEAGKGAGEHIGFYTWKKLLSKAHGIKALAQYLNVEESEIVETLRLYNSNAQDGKDAFGKATFPNPFSDSLDNEEFLVGQVTPVLHYCMGGLQINSMGQVLNDKGTVIDGLYAVGEVAGGVHGNNRLAGNSLLECLVFGGVIGKNLPLTMK